MKNMGSIVLLALVSFVIGTSQFIIVGLLDQVARALGVSIATAGQLITVFALGYAIGTPTIMALTARWAKRSQLLLALALALTGIALLLLMPGWVPALLSRVVLGAGAGVFTVTAFAYAGLVAAPERRGRVMSIIALGFSASLVLGIPLGRVIAAAWGWTSIFWILGALTVAGGLAVLWGIPAAKTEAPLPLKAQMGYLRQPRVILALSVSLVLFGGYYLTNTYITPLLGVLVPGEQSVSLVLFGLGIASLVGSQLAGFLADRLGVFRTLVTGVSVQVVALVLIASMRDVPGVAVAAVLVWTMAVWCCGPTLILNLVSIAPEAAGILLGLNNATVQLGIAAGSLVGGAVMSAWTVFGVTWISAALALAAGVIALFSFPRPVAQSPEASVCLADE
jgi:DHA1 family putative efflux transporter-like MFS transporter